MKENDNFKITSHTKSRVKMCSVFRFSVTKNSEKFSASIFWVEESMFTVRPGMDFLLLKSRNNGND